MIITNPLLPIPFPIPFLTEHDAPNKITFSSQKNINTVRNVSGYSFTHWGNQPDVIEASGAVILKPGMETLGLLSMLILKQLYKLDKQAVTSILGAATKTIKAISIGAIGASAAGELASQKWVLDKGLNKNITATSLGYASSLALESYLKAFSLIQYYKKINAASTSELSNTYIYHDNFIYGGFFTRFSYTRDITNYRMLTYNFSFTVDWSTENTFADMLMKATNSQTITNMSFGV